MIGAPTPAAAIRTYLKKDTPFLREEVECHMLSGLGLPQNVREMKLGQIYYLHTVMALKVNLPLPQNTMEIVSERGYDWRNERSLQFLQPHEALYLDTIVRLNELHGLYMKGPAEREHDAALKALQRRIA